MRERTVHINVRVTEKEKSAIERSAKKCKLSLSEFIRKLALGYVPKALPSELLFEMMSILRSIYDDFRIAGDGNADEIMRFVRCMEDEYINPERRR
jgi:hypothetical protein